MTRTDIHSPSNLVTENYEFAYCYDGHPEDGDRGACQPILNALIADGWRFDQIHGGDTCDHCGARLRYVAVLKHMPTRTLIKVGEQCLDNRFDLASEEFHRLRKAAMLNRERRNLSEKREAWLAEGDNQEAFDFCDASVNAGDYGYNGMYHDFVHNVNRYGDTSEKFVAAILRAKVRQQEWEARKAAEAATATDAPSGKTEIIGEVVAIKYQDTAYGTTEKMIVKDDAGFKVWVTVPRAIDNVQKGDRVTFTATLTPSDRDSTFAFGSRPSKAQILV